MLLKPNLLSGTAPEKAVTTHPAVVKAVIRAAKRRGVAAADITVADSPGGPHASGLVKACLLYTSMQDSINRAYPAQQ